MLQEHSRLFQRLLFVVDFLLVAAGWIAAYIIRFEWLIPPAWVSFERYLMLLPWVLLAATVVFWSSGLYAPDRANRAISVMASVGQAIALELVVVAATLSFYRDLSFSRLHMILFGVITPTLMVLVRLAVYGWIRRERRLGRNIQRVIIVGAGEAGLKLRRLFEQYPWMGIEVAGFVDDALPERLGTVDRLPELLDSLEESGSPIHHVYFALPLSETPRIQQLMEPLSRRTAHVHLVPDLFQYDIVNSRVTHVDGLPIIHLLDEAPMEMRIYAKRFLDVVFSVLFLSVMFPLLLAIALAVKLSSPGPVLYRQERMSLNGQRFQILKFRTMPVDVEARSGPVWARAGELRATRLGRFLRRTSLDELPQFVNVLLGDMSIVGPRPERPVFIESFRKQIPGYMLRHKTKAGITGWAQVNGWRGDTSLEKRIEHDLYYIHHWSIMLDLRIMALTVYRSLTDKNAY